MKHPTSRRDFLVRSTAALGLAALPAHAIATPEGSSGKKSRTLRIAHLTDMHVDYKLKDQVFDPAVGFANAIRHMQAQPDRPDFILFGGDLISDGLQTSKEKTLRQWALWKQVVEAEVTLPWHACIGNHDVWGWGLPQLEVARDPLFGKAMMMQELDLRDRYYSFDQVDWHIIVLDSLHRNHVIPSGYMARLDDEQMAWLAADLAATPATRPVIIFSHIPILGVSFFMNNGVVDKGAFVLDPGAMHTDVKALKNLFKQHPNVKGCISGHIHRVDEVHFLGVRYCCNGAVCARWWFGPYDEFPPAYSLIDLYDDGTFTNTIVPYDPA